MQIFRAFQAVPYTNRPIVKDVMASLHSYFTSNMLIGLAVLLSYKQFEGRPIDCMVCSEARYNDAIDVHCRSRWNSPALGRRYAIRSCRTTEYSLCFSMLRTTASFKTHTTSPSRIRSRTTASRRGKRAKSATIRYS